ncbi:hypothetical protein H6P81_001774 [Aristolochia fimbriata]|uniref:GH18 domain-containing protein n=1 Tax=Aristolochia fimbriata TaxID=158543 RepID=A0AAV7F901_ARIFI|nr:hypothetical protein H6P81_001774 [Aristolochia fimbriata]
MQREAMPKGNLFFLCFAFFFFFAVKLSYGGGNKVMMEYIGATGVPVTFDAVPVKDGIDFYFILSFAIDGDASGEPQNGVFSPYWAPTLTPESVSAIKQQYPNVKALASLSGWSLRDKVLQRYDPEDPELWISNAVSSLQSLVTTYHLDGIDVDYENFPRPRNNSTPSLFPYCVGELITRLKNRGIITTATIAPYYKTVAPYVDLHGRYSAVIDYVNHQFYTDKVKTPRDYLGAFRLRAEQFGGAEKVLPSYEVKGRGIQGDAFFAALELLEEKGFGVNGVMIFSADASASDGSYYYEVQSQNFLLNSTNTS